MSTTHPSELSVAAATCDANAMLWKPDLRAGLLEAIWLRHGRPDTT